MRIAALSVVLLSLASFDQTPVKAALQPAASRQPAPAFRLHDATGRTVELSAFLGKVVVLNLWATDCGGCKAELPSFVALDRGYRDRGVAVIGVSMDVMYEDLKSPAEGWARVTPFAAAHGMRYTVVLDDGSVEKAYKLTAMPATYLIDAHGRVAATYVGIVDAADLEANVKALLRD
jgi:peroxiredoxin